MGKHLPALLFGPSMSSRKTASQQLIKCCIFHKLRLLRIVQMVESCALHHSFPPGSSGMSGEAGTPCTTATGLGSVPRASPRPPTPPSALTRHTRTGCEQSELLASREGAVHLPGQSDTLFQGQHLWPDHISQSRLCSSAHRTGEVVPLSGGCSGNSES